MTNVREEEASDGRDGCVRLPRPRLVSTGATMCAQAPLISCSLGCEMPHGETHGEDEHKMMQDEITGENL